MNATTCARCPRELVPARGWAKATASQRATWTAQGKAIHQARGLCRGCYLKAHRSGEVVHSRPGVGGRGRVGVTVTKPPSPCVRCGIATRNELCRDCREVVAA